MADRHPLCDEKPLRVVYKGEDRWATWGDNGREVNVSSAYGSDRKPCHADSPAEAKEKAKRMFLAILKKGTRH